MNTTIASQWVSAFLCLFIAASYPSYTYAEPADTSVKSEEILRRTGNTGLILTKTQNDSINFSVDSTLLSSLPTESANALFFPSDCELLKVGNSYVRGRTIDELNAMLTGPVDSTIPFTYLAGDEIKSGSLTRYSADKFVDKNDSRSDYIEKLSSLEALFKATRSEENLWFEGKHLHKAGADFAAEPYFISLSAQSAYRFNTFHDSYVSAIPDTLKFFWQTGKLRSFIQMRDAAVESARALTDECSDSDARALSEASSILASLGFSSNALAVGQKLYAISPHLPPQSRAGVSNLCSRPATNQRHRRSKEGQRRVAGNMSAL